MNSNLIFLCMSFYFVHHLNDDLIKFVGNKYSCHTLSKHIVISNPTSFNQAWTNENESSNIQLRSICNFESRKGKCTHLFNIMSHTITFICERRRYRITWEHTRHVHTTQSTFNSIIQQYFINEIDKICFSFQLNERSGG